MREAWNHGCFSFTLIFWLPSQPKIRLVWAKNHQNFPQNQLLPISTIFSYYGNCWRWIEVKKSLCTRGPIITRLYMRYIMEVAEVYHDQRDTLKHISIYLFSPSFEVKISTPCEKYGQIWNLQKNLAWNYFLCNALNAVGTKPQLLSSWMIWGLISAVGAKPELLSLWVIWGLMIT